MIDCPKIELGQLTTTINGLWTGKKPPFKTVAVIRNTNFSKDCRLKMDDVAMIDVEERQFATRKLQVGDIIIEKSGGSDKQPVGRPVIFNIPDGDYSFSNFTSALRVNDKSKVLPEYLQKFLYKFYLTGKTAEMQSKTTGLRNLDFNAYKQIKVPVPTVEEQQRIVSELDLLTAVIDKKNNQIRDLDSLAKSIFFEMFGEPDEHSDRWTACVVGDCFVSIKNGANIKQSKGAGGIPITRIETLSNGVFNRDRLGYADIFDTEKYSSFILSDGDILMSHINSKTYIGRSVVYKYLPGETIIHGMNLLRLIPKNDVINPVYAKFFFDTVFFKRQVASIRKDAVNQSSMAVGDLKKLRIYLPPIELQSSFCEKVSAIESQKAIIRASIDSSSVLLSSRMDYWFM